MLYEGKPVGTPDAGAFWRVVERARRGGAVHRADRVPRDPQGGSRGGAAGRHDLCRRSRALFLAGERTDPDTYHWASALLGVPVIDHWWQTETGWSIAANCPGSSRCRSSRGRRASPCPATTCDILDADGDACRPATQGAIAMRLPLPPGALPTLWNDDERFVASYLSRYPGWYLTGDGGHVDEDGYLFVMGRIDDVINVAGHRLSTGAMEEVVGDAPRRRGVRRLRRAGRAARRGAARARRAQGRRASASGRAARPSSSRSSASGSARSRASATRAWCPSAEDALGQGAARHDARIAAGREYAVPATIDDPAIIGEIADALAEPRSR